MKVLFIVPYPWGEAPSQRFRFEQYFDVLKREGYILRIASFLSPGVWKIFYKKGHFWAKSMGIVKGFFNRILLLHTVPQYGVCLWCVCMWCVYVWCGVCVCGLFMCVCVCLCWEWCVVCVYGVCVLCV